MGNLQIIQQKGKPAFVVIPHKDWKRIQEDLEELDDIKAYHEAKRDFEADNHRAYPAEMIYRMLDGENRVKVTREWRKLSQGQLAARTGLSKSVISHIETGVRNGGMKTLGKIAAALDVSLDFLQPVKKS